MVVRSTLRGCPDCGAELGEPHDIGEHGYREALRGPEPLVGDPGERDRRDSVPRGLQALAELAESEQRMIWGDR